MHRLENSNQELGIRVLYSGSLFPISFFLVPNTCGLPGQKLLVRLGIENRLINMLGAYGVDYVYKQPRFALHFTQAYTFLYTVFQHIQEYISSVKTAVVHIFHSAYIKNNFLKKGKLIKT